MRRFSSTVRLAKIRRPSGTSEMPSRAIRSGGRPTSWMPSNSIDPDAGRTRPVIAATVVVFPAPFAPTTPTSSPSATLNDTPRTAVMCP